MKAPLYIIASMMALFLSNEPRFFIIGTAVGMLCLGIAIAYFYLDD